MGISLRILNNLTVSLMESSKDLDKRLADTGTNYRESVNGECRHYLIFTDDSGAEIQVKGDKVVSVLTRKDALNKLFEIDTSEKSSIKSRALEIEFGLALYLGAEASITGIQLSRLNLDRRAYIFELSTTEYPDYTGIRIKVKEVDGAVYADTIEIIGLQK